MARVNLVPPPPLQTPVLDVNGNIAMPWAMWFNGVYDRIANKESNSIDDNQADLDLIYETLAEQLVLILANSVDIATNATNIAINVTDIDALEAKSLRDETLIETSATETIDLAVNGLIKQTASDIITSFTGQVTGQTITVINSSGGTNTLNTTVDGVYLPKIYDGESFTIYYNGTDWDIR